MSDDPDPANRVRAEVERLRAEGANGRTHANPVDNANGHNSHAGASAQTTECRALLAVDVARLERPPIRSYSTGITELDALIGGGLATRQLATVLGPPAAGKTAFAVALALHVSRKLSVLYASTELEGDELVARLVAPVIDCPWAKIVRGHVPRADVIKALDGLPIRLLGCETLPSDGTKALEVVEREAAAMASGSGLPPFVVIDYLQDLARGAERDLRARVGDTATALRAMSQRLDSPVLAVSSVSRSYYSARKAAEMREINDPTVYLAAAKESGDVDYASAVVIFLDVEEDRGLPERETRIAVAKSRHGRAGFAGARFAGANGRWIPSASSAVATSPTDRARMRTAAAESKANDAVMQLLVRLHTAGDSALGTRTYVRASSGIQAIAAGCALDRLVLSGLVRLETTERLEGGRMKKREICLLGRSTVANLAPQPAAQCELEVDRRRALHGDGS